LTGGFPSSARTTARAKEGDGLSRGVADKSSRAPAEKARLSSAPLAAANRPEIPTISPFKNPMKIHFDPRAFDRYVSMESSVLIGGSISFV
jgi:hypothetical protein